MKAEFEKMISENRSLILRICRFYNAWNEKEAIEDLYQEIVLNLWEGYPKFINNQRCKPSTWLYRVALNTALLQKRNERKITYIPLNNQTLSETCSDDNDLQINVLYRLIEKLNSEDKTIIYLYLDDLSHKEIAEILGISETNVGTKIHRIKSKLKKLNKTDE
ncbi:MAG TPA: sigma-70 family RNA polymerase sigma factor [Salinivirgaceae bacterium]|nr:sigma-70 family RNA polymerase sigma factor [Salinivirgaceae bacterium]HQA76695.1 sigma-70 family RNA polymerase sigma factor [Salinivirgaceae bacterium]